VTVFFQVSGIYSKRGGWKHRPPCPGPNLSARSCGESGAELAKVCPATLELWSYTPEHQLGLRLQGNSSMDGTKDNHDSADITALLRKIKQGDAAAESHLIPLIYNELRAIARNHMGRERPDHSLQATVLVHDAFLQLVGNSQIDWCNRAHFFALASRVMRHILVDHARAARAKEPI
jgi:ECF sigma factor